MRKLTATLCLTLAVLLGSGSANASEHCEDTSDPRYDPSECEEPREKVRPSEAEWKRVILGTSWESKHLLLGAIKYKNNGEKGLIEASWPSASLWCEGTWQIESGKYENNNKKPYSEWDIVIGTWTIECNGGSAASGTYESDEIGEFIGIGKDTNGNTVKFEAPIHAWTIGDWSKELLQK